MPRFTTAINLLRAADRFNRAKKGIPFNAIPESITKPSAIPEGPGWFGNHDDKGIFSRGEDD